jgi:hypothetical protein
VPDFEFSALIPGQEWLSDDDRLAATVELHSAQLQLFCLPSLTSPSHV